MDKGLASLTACQLKRLLDAGEISAAEVMRHTLAEIDRQEATIRAFILPPTADHAPAGGLAKARSRADLLAEAESLDRRRRAGERLGPLAGLPIALKDNICTRDLATTCASKMLANFVPPYDATVVERIRKADGIILGKTNLDEFAMGSSTENSAFHVTRNPHDPERVPGGTSGGSAAAVAAGETVLALGSDTGGSIRQPASFCGVVGLKPTYGRVSRFGLVAHGSSLDQIGPMARDTSDAALLLSVIAGHDPRDSTSLPQPVPELTALRPTQGLRIGIPAEYFGEGLDPEVRAAVEAALHALRSQGHQTLPISLPHTRFAVPTYYIIACAEASANLARFDGVRYGFRSKDARDVGELYERTRSEGFGPEVKRRIMLGTYVLSSHYYDAYYLRAMKVRTLIRRDFTEAFQQCDVIAHPVAPTPAYRLGEKTDDPLAMYLGDIYSVVANLAGLPAISLPCGRSSKNLPIGLQLTADSLREDQLVAAALAVEKALLPPPRAAS